MSVRRRPLLKDDERIALVHRLALLTADLLHGALVLGFDWHLHLHRLEDHDGVALVDLVADLAFDLPHGARDVGLDVRHALPPEMGLGTRAGTIAAPMDVPAIVVIVAAHNEGDRIEQTLGALAEAFPGARVLVADDASTDDTAARAQAAGAEVVTAPRNIGKGGANTLAARRVLSLALTPQPPVFVLCDGDLGDTARQLPALVAAVRRGECDLAVGAFAKRVGGGFGVAVGYARAAIRRLTGLELDAPISG